jgi:hypothetical protein
VLRGSIGNRRLALSRLLSQLPSKIQTAANLVASIEKRHRRRQNAKDFAYEKQANILSASG